MNLLEKYNLSLRDVVFMIAMALAQAATAIWAKDDMLSFVSGMAGIISVVLCSQKKMTFYVFGFIQLFTYMAIVYKERLWGEFIENIFYAVTMVVGIFVWIKNYDKEKLEVKPKELSFVGRALCADLLFIGLIVSIIVMDLFTNDSQPIWDSISTVPAFIAQILMIAGYKEQWIYWLIVDVSSIVMWAIIGNPFMVVQFSLWTINCIYGMMKWRTGNETT